MGEQKGRHFRLALLPLQLVENREEGGWGAVQAAQHRQGFPVSLIFEGAGVGVANEALGDALDRIVVAADQSAITVKITEGIREGAVTPGVLITVLIANATLRSSVAIEAMAGNRSGRARRWRRRKSDGLAVKANGVVPNRAEPEA
jgi:hypothetical protein